MAAPTFIAKAEVASWQTTTTPKATGSFAVVAGDILVAASVIGDNGGTIVTPTNTGTALNWSLQESVSGASRCPIGIWTTTATVTESITVSFACGSSSQEFGGVVLQFRASDGIGAVAQDQWAGASDPTLAITTTQANSALVMAVGDWNAVDGATRAYETGTAGAFTEQVYSFATTKYTAYVGYYADAGTVAAKTVGLTLPDGQQWTIAAVEVKGSGGTLGIVLGEPIVGGSSF